METKDAIKLLRERTGLTQQGLAGELKLAVSSVARYEAGGKPRLAVLNSLAVLALQRGQAELSGQFARKAMQQLDPQGEIFNSENSQLLKAREALSMTIFLPDHLEYEEFKENFIDFSEMLEEPEEYEQELKAWAKLRASIARKREAKK